MVNRRVGALVAPCMIVQSIAGGLACSPTEQPLVPPVPAFSERLVSGRLPFQVAGQIPLLDSNDTEHIGALEDIGPDVGLSMYHTDLGLPGTQQARGSLVAVAALPDRMIVVYPSAVQIGFDVAVGGLDLPWTSQHLSDVPRERAGAIDAIADNDGGAFVVLRERYMPYGPGGVSPPAPVRFFTLSSTGALISEETISGLEQSLPWYQDRCPDVQLGVSIAGDVDVVVLGPRHARRLAGSAFWDIQQIDFERIIDFSQVLDVGCRNRIAYDEADLPQLLSLSRIFPVQPAVDPPPPLGPTQLGTNHFGDSPAALPETTTIGFFVGGDGIWRSASRGPNASWTMSHPWHEGGFDVETHPDGYVMSGPQLSLSEPTVSFKITSFVRDETTLSKLELDLNLNPDLVGFEENLNLRGNTEKMHFSACGGLETRGTGSPSVSGGLPTSFEEGATPELCAHDAHAPAFNVGPSALVLERRPVYAHGRRPYNVGICLTEQRELSVCVNAVATPEVAPASDAPILVSSEPADGAVDVDVATNTLVFHFDRDVSGLLITAQLADVTIGRAFFEQVAEERVVVEVSGSTVTARLPTGLRAGDRYRAALRISDANANAFTYVAQTPPVFSFTTAGRVFHDDLRFTSTAGCSATQSFVDGVCFVGVDVPINEGTQLILSIDYDQRHNNVGNLQLADPNGTRVDITVEQPIFPADLLRHQIITFDEQLAPNTRYTLTVPPNARNSYGALMLDADRIYAFVTAP